MQTPNGVSLTVEVPGSGSIAGSGFATVNQFFVLEGGTAQAELIGRFSNPCEPIVNGAVNVSTLNNNRTIDATFTPNFGLSINDAANLCGYDSFRWYQLVTQDPFPPTVNGQPLTPPYLDPPLGGYDYQQPAGDDFLPFYWNASELPSFTTNSTFTLQDTPAEPRLQPNQFIVFNTSLVGVLPNSNNMQWDVLYNFNWRTNFNGTSGGISTRKNLVPPDDNGTGGIFGIELDLSPEDLSEEIKRQLQEDGAQNAFSSAPSSTQVPEPSGLVGLFAAFATGLIFNQRKKFKK